MHLIFVLIITLYIEEFYKVNSLESKYRSSMEQHHADKIVWGGITLLSVFQLILNFSLGILWKEISKCICSIFPEKEIKNPINTLSNSLSALQHCWTMFHHLPVPTSRSTSLSKQLCLWSCLPAPLLNKGSRQYQLKGSSILLYW